MQEVAAVLKHDIESGKKLKIEDNFFLKLPSSDSHEFHETEGEVLCFDYEFEKFYKSLSPVPFTNKRISTTKTRTVYNTDVKH